MQNQTDLPQLKHTKMKTDSNALNESEIYPLLSSPRLGMPPAPRSSCNPEVVVHMNTIRSVYPKSMEIPFHSTDQPALRVLLPRSTVYPRPILEVNKLTLTMAILNVAVDLGILHHKIQQQQLTLEA